MCNAWDAEIFRNPFLFIKKNWSLSILYKVKKPDIDSVKSGLTGITHTVHGILSFHECKQCMLVLVAGRVTNGGGAAVMNVSRGSQKAWQASGVQHPTTRWPLVDKSQD